MTPITTMDRNATKLLAAETDKALKAVAEQFGLTYVPGSFRYDPTVGNLKGSFTLAIAGAEAAKFARDLNSLYGTTVTAEDFGAEFMSRGQKFRLDGVNLRAPKFPFMGTEIATNKKFRFSQSAVESALKIAARQ